MKKIYWLLIAAALIFALLCGYFIKNFQESQKKQTEIQNIQQSFEKAAKEPIPKNTPFNDPMLNN